MGWPRTVPFSDNIAIRFLVILVPKLVIFLGSICRQISLKKLIIVRSGGILSALYCICVILFGEALGG